MTEEDLKAELARISKKIGVVTVKHPKPQKTKLDQWLKKAISESSCF